MHDGGPNPKLITCGTALGAHRSQSAALSSGSRLISIPPLPSEWSREQSHQRGTGHLL